MRLPVLLLLALAACAPGDFTRAGATPDQRRADFESCTAEAAAAVPVDMQPARSVDTRGRVERSTADANNNRRLQARVACMEGRGYRR